MHQPLLRQNRKRIAPLLSQLASSSYLQLEKFISGRIFMDKEQSLNAEFCLFYSCNLLMGFVCRIPIILYDHLVYFLCFIKLFFLLQSHPILPGNFYSDLFPFNTDTAADALVSTANIMHRRSSQPDQKENGEEVRRLHSNTRANKVKGEESTENSPGHPVPACLDSTEQPPL